jgi:hypothetical protein
MSVGFSNPDGLSILNFNYDISRLLLGPRVLRHGVVTECQSLHKAMRDSLEAIICKEIEANRHAHTGIP